ncbi:hypothetical protein CLAIMM_09670 [Cladophialophora immunda]|nr:hypothetical protein CLAIMM_09670 [Cladophialophora immunda]
MTAQNGVTNGNHHSSPKVSFTEFTQYIDGAAVDTKATRCGINPATKQNLWPVPVSTSDHLDRAVEAATKAFKTWSRKPYEERQRSVLAFADAVEEYKEELTNLLTTEQGKPTWQAALEAGAGIDWIRGMAKLSVPEDVVEETDTKKTVVRYTPIGVVGAIIPWNFPLMLCTAKIAPALLTGNVVICKPSPFAPYCGLKLCEIAQRFFPPGVVQSISGGDDVGPWMTSHPGIGKISFTGSSPTGKLVMQSCAKTLKRVVLELGGNDPAIVCGDVDIEKVAPKIATFAFLNSGQICLNMKRIYVHESIYQEFLTAMARHVKTMTMGNGLDSGIVLGPLQNKMQYDRVARFFDDIPKENWKAVTGGKMKDSNGYFIEPTIIDNPPDNSRIVMEEPFGPIVPALPWKTEDEVVRRANDTRMGLGASIWSRDLERADRLARQMEAGSVWINSHFDLSPLAPFGGHKESGIGTEWGINGLKAMCNVQSIFYNKSLDEV